MSCKSVCTLRPCACLGGGRAGRRAGGRVSVRTGGQAGGRGSSHSSRRDKECDRSDIQRHEYLRAFRRKDEFEALERLQLTLESQQRKHLFPKPARRALRAACPRAADRAAQIRLTQARASAAERAGGGVGGLGALAAAGAS